MANAKYKGHEIAFVEFIIKEDAYALFDIDGDLVTTLKRHEFLSQPQLRTIGNSHGRYRKSRPSLYLHTAGQSGGAGPAGTVFSPGTITLVSGPSHIPIDDAGIRAGEVTAHRCWWLKEGRLFSVYMSHYEWLPNSPANGEVNHGFGIHGFKEKDSLIEYGQAILNSICISSPAVRLIAGTVSMWGEIVEHQRGYRAEYAKIKSLDTNDGDLKKRYGV